MKITNYLTACPEHSGTLKVTINIVLQFKQINYLVIDDI